MPDHYEGATAQMRLASLNLHCGLDGSGAAYPVEAAIAAVDADVILIQENWRPDGAVSLAARAAAAQGYPSYTDLDMVEGTPLAELEIVDGEVPDEAGAWGLAIMSRLPFRSVSTVPIGSAPKDVVGERAAQVVEVACGDAVLRLVNVHLTHRLLHGPAQLRRLIAGLRGAATPTVIAGDLNMCRPTIGLARPFRPAVRGRTFPAHRPLVQLDHILAGPGVHATATAIGAAVGSDHRPVHATIGTARVGAAGRV